ncbi:MAG: L-threonylcarbamoyladenylate synthase, partial [Sphingopyxis sp.]
MVMHTKSPTPAPTPPAHTTRTLPYGAAAVADGAAIIRAGGCVAVPTETVYGLAADATSAAGVAGIYAAKGRPDFNPLIVHVADRAMADALGEWNDVARHLADCFWPGPLTIVVPRAPDCPVATIATAGLDSIALRCPAHPAMQALIRAAARPLAAPSANASGTVSPTSAAHVLRTLAGHVPLVIDAGPCAQGLESTIVRPSADHITLLRPGPITAEDLAARTGLPVRGDDSGTVTAPGQLASHYAPGKPVLLDCVARVDGAFHIGFGPGPCDYSLSQSGDAVAGAAHLFDAL